MKTSDLRPKAVLALLGVVVTITTALASVTTLAGPVSADESTDVEAPPSKNYLRAEVSQTPLVDFAGTLTLTGEGFEETSVPVSASAGEQLKAFVQVPERMGFYRLDLTTPDRSKPALYQEGFLERISEGVYLHHPGNSDADPHIFELTPDEVGITIALGSVSGHLQVCIKLLAPMDGTAEIGVDADGNGAITADEMVIETLENRSNGCAETAETSLPLTSLYAARFRTSDGRVVAFNEGLYDFLFKSGVNSKKDAPKNLVHELAVRFTRKPKAIAVEILNASIKAPEVHANVVEQKEEVTEDIIRNGPVVTSPTPTAIPIGTPVIPAKPMRGEGPSVDLAELLIRYWQWLVVLAAISLATFLYFRRNRAFTQ